MIGTSSKKCINIGVIGCGEISQLMHLPILHELPEVKIAALCDLSLNVLEGLGAIYGTSALYQNYHDVLHSPDVDAVVIATFDHAPVVQAAIAAGKHFIVEKPLSFTTDEARPLIEQFLKSGNRFSDKNCGKNNDLERFAEPSEAKNALEAAQMSHLVAMVGYMKYYDPGYQLGLEHIARIGRPKMVHIHDFAGRFDRYPQLYSQLRGHDVDKTLLEEEQRAVKDRVAAALGSSHAGYVDLYLMLLMLGSHDLAVMRGAFGRHVKVNYARAVSDKHIMAILEFDQQIPALLEVAIGAQYEWWDEWMEVYGEEDTVRIDFPNPYIRNVSAVVRLRESSGDAPVERILHSQPETAFRRQWQHFIACIQGKTTPLTSLQDGFDDLDLAQRIIKSLPEKTKTPPTSSDKLA